MNYTYYPKGVCSRKFEFQLENGIIQEAKVEGGCNGNLKGICSLIKGMSIDKVISSFDGISCSGKPTSCPDQIAKALKEYQKK